MFHHYVTQWHKHYRSSQPNKWNTEVPKHLYLYIYALRGSSKSVDDCLRVDFRTDFGNCSKLILPFIIKKDGKRSVPDISGQTRVEVMLHNAEQHTEFH
jgi:hypothetical protein